MTCPYPYCGSESDSLVTQGPCGRCRQYAFLCRNCGSVNRVLARFCCNCGTKIRYQLSDAQISASLKNQIEPTRVAEVHGLNHDLASYGPFVWALSECGDLYETSSGVQQLKKCLTLPGGGFTFPLRVEENERLGPVVYANNSRTCFRYTHLTGESKEVFKVDGMGDSIAGGVLKHGENFYYLTTDDGMQGPAMLRSTGSSESYPLNDVTVADSLFHPLHCVGNDLWLLTREKLLVFPGFSLDSCKELHWNPWHIWTTNNGLWYSEKKQIPQLGEKQSLFRVTFEGGEFGRYALVQELPLTAKIAVDLYEGQIAILTPQAIKVHDFTMNTIDGFSGVVQTNNPLGVLLTSSFLFWFEAENRSVYGWEIQSREIRRLSSSERKISFSRFVLVAGALYGLAKEEIWKWDLLGL